MSAQMSRSTRLLLRPFSIAAFGGVIAGLLAIWAWSRKQPERSTSALSDPPAIDMARVAESDDAVIRAVEEARAAVRAAPRSAAAWGRLGMMLLAHGAPADASDICFAQAERLDPHEARWPYFRGTSLLERDPDNAIPMLARAAELCGDRPDTPRLKLADALMARGRLAEAEVHFRRCLHAHPGHARAILGLGRLAYLRGNLQEAENRLSAVASDSRTLKAASTLLVEVHHRAGDRAKAGQLLAGMSEMRDDPPWPDPLMAEVERMEVGRKRSLSVAMALMRAHRLREAITLLQQTLDQYPDSERVLLLLGLAHNMADNWSEGERVLRQAVTISPNAPRAYYQLGLALVAQNRFAEAAECFDKASQLMPNDAAACFHLGRCRARLGDAPAAERAFRAALDARPAFADAHRELADLLENSGRRDEARSHFQQALNLNPRDSEAARLFGEMGPATFPR